MTAYKSILNKSSFQTCIFGGLQLGGGALTGGLQYIPGNVGKHKSKLIQHKNTKKAIEYNSVIVVD